MPSLKCNSWLRVNVDRTPPIFLLLDGGGWGELTEALGSFHTVLWYQNSLKRRALGGLAPPLAGSLPSPTDWHCRGFLCPGGSVRMWMRSGVNEGWPHAGAATHLIQVAEVFERCLFYTPGEWGDLQRMAELPPGPLVSGGNMIWGLGAGVWLLTHWSGISGLPSGCLNWRTQFDQ